MYALHQTAEVKKCDKKKSKKKCIKIYKMPEEKILISH